MNIIIKGDVTQVSKKPTQIASIKFFTMVYSKSFGYALRGVLYVALMSDEKKRVQIDEIAEKLSVPKHFLGKIMNRIVKAGILDSTKGPYGGFSMNQSTLQTSILKVFEVTDGKERYTTCALSMRDCNADYPCPLHKHNEKLREDFKNRFSVTTINDLVTVEKPELIRSITVA
jgi:Rrf2 family iron-sulfur cluster assembly transcriptional regulator